MFKKSLKLAQKVPYIEVEQNAVEGSDILSTLRILKKQLRKWVLLAMTGQLSRLKDSLKVPEGSKILFVYLGANNIGDALMDFSSRHLLVGKGYRLDVWLDPSLKELFKFDEYFGHVYSDPTDIDFSQYSCLLLNNLNPRTVRAKIKHARGHLFASLNGWYSGPHYNHIQMSYFGVNSVFSLGMGASTLIEEARLILTNPVQLQGELARYEDFIVIAVGGRESHRVYSKWSKVIRLIGQDVDLRGAKILLMGSENGLQDAQKILSSAVDGTNLINLVGELSLFECHALLKRCSLLVCTDGGLMHLAHAAGAQTLALFSSEFSPDKQFIHNKNFRCSPIQGRVDVNSIEPEEVFSKLRGLLL